MPEPQCELYYRTGFSCWYLWSSLKPLIKWSIVMMTPLYDEEFHPQFVVDMGAEALLEKSGRLDWLPPRQNVFKLSQLLENHDE